MPTDERTSSVPFNRFEKFTYIIVQNIERFFYKLGYRIAKRPKLTILLCWLIVFLGAAGMLRFYQEKNPIKLWVPRNTRFVDDTNWLMEKFQRGFREQISLIIAPNVLTPQILQQALQIDRIVKHTKSPNNITLNDVCFTIPKVDSRLLKLLEGGRGRNSNKNRNESDDTQIDLSTRINAAIYCSFVETMEIECFAKNILHLWNYDENVIGKLTQQEILNEINGYDKTSVLGRLINYEQLLGGIERNGSGHIIGAKALHTYWTVNVNFSAVDMDKVGNIAGTADWVSEEALEWEQEFIYLMENASRTIPDNVTLYYTAGRSFGDISSATMFQDMGILSIGVIIMVLYVQFVISKLNLLEYRIILGSAGLLAIGMAFCVACGLCALIGIPYGPVHTSLPFLLMGLGVDDMFVIMACWQHLSQMEQNLPLPERVGLMLKHAGVSITVTSITDIMAFVIGSSTVIPCLQSYCLYAAVGVLWTFIFATTFFIAVFVLDEKRIQQRRNALIVCLKHKKRRNVEETNGTTIAPTKTGIDTEELEDKENEDTTISRRIFHYIYSQMILTTPGKIFIIALTVICFAVSMESLLRLEQRFDPTWFLPKESYLNQYLIKRKFYYPNSGFEAGLYIGAINYTHEIRNLNAMVAQLYEQNGNVHNIISWIEPFHRFVQVNFKTDIYEETLSDEYFNQYLSMFLYSPRNAQYQANIHFAKKLECGVPAPKIIMSNVDFRFKYFSTPDEYLPVMHAVDDIAKSANFTTGDRFVTAWSRIFSSWITDELINTEVIRNLLLALLAVMLCTVMLIANLQVCFWILLCVIMTMVNVCGFMQRWGQTIDLVSCVALELAVGLCVDYATHIGHTFLTTRRGTRNERALKTVRKIGSAVMAGGFSTLIGVFMLSQSEAYTFQAFFKIFLLVVLFGLFHGVVLLPVIFSLIGPPPYSSTIQFTNDKNVEPTTPITSATTTCILGENGKEIEMISLTK